MEVEINGKKYNARKVSWKEEEEIEADVRTSLKQKRVEYYNRVLEKMLDMDQDASDMLNKLDIAEGEYFIALMESNMKFISASLGVDKSVIEGLSVDEITKLVSMLKRYSSSLIDDSKIIDVMAIVKEYAIEHQDNGLIELIDTIEDNYFSIKKK